MFGSCVCQRCQTCAPPRSVRSWDRILQTCGRIDAQIDESDAPNLQNESADVPEIMSSTLALPTDFLSRVLYLTSATLMHIPVQFRKRMVGFPLHTMEGMLAGHISVNLLEQARSKLLLAALPQGRNMQRELGIRFGLWENASFGELIIRNEE